MSTKILLFRIALIGAAIVYVYFASHHKERAFRPPMKVYKERLFRA